MVEAAAEAEHPVALLVDAAGLAAPAEVSRPEDEVAAASAGAQAVVLAAVRAAVAVAEDEVQHRVEAEAADAADRKRRSSAIAPGVRPIKFGFRPPSRREIQYWMRVPFRSTGKSKPRNPMPTTVME